MTDPGLTAGDAARRLGVAITTLRSWHQRYGLGPTGHQPPHHRRYTPQDMGRLEAMHRLTGQGVPARQAARIALTEAPPTTAVHIKRDAVIATASTVRGLTRMAARLDTTAMSRIIDGAIREHGVVHTWDQIIRPVLATLGERHQGTHHAIDVEHLLTRAVSEAFAISSRPPNGASPRTLLACADEEQHTLAMEALAAALVSHGVGCRQLGARVPAVAVANAVARTGSEVVVLWSQMAATGDPRQLETLLDVRPKLAAILAAGPGWPDAALPAGVQRPADLAEAVAMTLTVTGTGH